MPLVRIDLMEGKLPEYRRALADGVYQALLEAVDAPENDPGKGPKDSPYRGCT